MSATKQTKAPLQFDLEQLFLFDYIRDKILRNVVCAELSLMAIRKLHFLRMSLNSNYRSLKISLSCLTDKTVEKANCLLECFYLVVQGRANYALTEPFGFLPPCGVLCRIVRYNILCTDNINYMPLLPKFAPKRQSKITLKPLKKLSGQ